MKKILLSVCLITSVLLLWHYRFTVTHVPQSLPSLSSSPIVEKLVATISAPEPLRTISKIPSVASPSEVPLTMSGVTVWTNSQRRQNGNLPPLKENAKLNKSALIKAQDMLTRQYFEHESPDGKGPGDLAQTVGYAYLSIGENLALGNFDTDKALVQAWMDSPGHRANILNDKYTEIGVAVVKGMYEGKMTWLAVQEFGRPSSNCPGIDQDLQGLIATHKAELSVREQEVQAKKDSLQAFSPKTQEEVNAYNAEVSVYNDLVRSYNAMLESLKTEISTYNAEVNAYNLCLKGV